AGGICAGRRFRRGLLGSQACHAQGRAREEAMSDVLRMSVEIEAPADDVFDYFLRPELLVRWMGDVARLEARSGGVVSVDINGVPIRGHFVRIERPHFIEIAWGEAGNDAMPPGATRLCISFEAQGSMTHVMLEHHGLVRDEAKKHAMGWPHFLERLVL